MLLLPPLLLPPPPLLLLLPVLPLLLHPSESVTPTRVQTSSRSRSSRIEAIPTRAYPASSSP